MKYLIFVTFALAVATALETKPVEAPKPKRSVYEPAYGYDTTGLLQSGYGYNGGLVKTGLVNTNIVKTGVVGGYDGLINSGLTSGFYGSSGLAGLSTGSTSGFYGSSGLAGLSTGSTSGLYGSSGLAGLSTGSTSGLYGSSGYVADSRLYGVNSGVISSYSGLGSGHYVGPPTTSYSSQVHYAPSVKQIKTITKHVQVPVGVPQPYPVHVTRNVPVPYPVHVNKPVPVQVQVRVPVEVPKPYPVHVIKNVPVPYNVYKPYPVTVTKNVAVPVEVPRPYPVHVTKNVAVPYEVVKPYPVHVTKNVQVPVATPVYVKVPHPVKVVVPQPYAVHVPQPYPVKVYTPQVYNVGHVGYDHGISTYGLNSGIHAIGATYPEAAHIGTSNVVEQVGHDVSLGVSHVPAVEATNLGSSFVDHGAQFNGFSSTTVAPVTGGAAWNGFSSTISPLTDVNEYVPSSTYKSI